MRGGLPERHTAAQPIRTALKGKGRALGRVRPRRGCPRPATGPASLRPEAPRDPARRGETGEQKQWPCSRALPDTQAHIPLSPGGAVLASQRSGMQGVPQPFPSGIPRGHPARPCTPRPYLVGIRDQRRKSRPRTAAVLPTPAAVPPHIQTRQNGAAARLGSGRMREQGRGRGRGRGRGPAHPKSKDQSLICMPGLWVCADVTSDNALWFRRF